MELLISNKLKEQNMTQKRLAELIGISRSHLANIINQKRSCDIELLEKIANVLNVSVISLIKDEHSSIVSTFKTDESVFEIRKINR